MKKTDTVITKKVKGINKNLCLLSGETLGNFCTDGNMNTTICLM